MRKFGLGTAIVKKTAYLLLAGLLLLSLAGSYSAPAEAQPAASYKLPWEPGVQHEVGQGNFQQDASGKCVSGCGTHYIRSMRFAWDFSLAEGTKVLAARGGSVALMQDKWDANHFGSPYPIKNPPPGYIVDPDIANQANYVVVDHGDGSAALYLHLSKVADAIKAKGRTKGRVEQGEELGLSGKTGWTHGYPHLHFQVQAAGGWFTQSRSISFSDKDVLAKNPDGMPTAGNSYVSDNTPSAHPIVGKWQRVAGSRGSLGSFETIELSSDGKFVLPQGAEVAVSYKILDGDRLQLEVSEPGRTQSIVVPFKITGERLTLTVEGPQAAPLPGAKMPQPTPTPYYLTAEYQRVTGAQLPPQQASPPVAQATIAAQQAQIAALQTSVARQATPVQRPTVGPVANTPTAAARMFIQALIRGDINAALQLMPASAQTNARAVLPTISNALGPCSGSQAEAAGGTPQGGIITVQFTPMCGNYGLFFNALPLQSPDGISQQSMAYWVPVDRNGARPLGACTVTVGRVNDEWKVYYIPFCFPVQ